MDKIVIKNEIIESFQNTEYPGDDNIVYKTIYDNEVKTCEAKFIGKKWQDVKWQDIADEGYASGCAFLTIEAYCYFLPAYMIAIISHPTEMLGSTDAVLSSLTPPNREHYQDMQKAFNERIDLKSFFESQIQNIDDEEEVFYLKASKFNHGQIKSIQLFLNYIEEIYVEDDIDKKSVSTAKLFWDNL